MTCDPQFYKHTQRIFLMMLKHGLAYQAESLVNFDPIDRTVLANEQVDANGRSWRSGALVEKRRLKQWFLRVTAYQDALLHDLEILRQNGWPERVLSMQRNWLGKSDGANIRFAINAAESIEVFTTRPDTLFGVQYLALSTAHPLVLRQAAHDTRLQRFLAQVPSLPADTKVGFRLDIRATNPLLRLLDHQAPWNQPLPIFVAPYVLPEYGTGAVMGVPGHDMRDDQFWRENGDGDARLVIEPPEKPQATAQFTTPFTGHGTLLPLCGQYAGMDSTATGKRIVSDLTRSGNLAEAAHMWKLRDWLISRQRYWGTPIPIIHCHTCGAVPVPEDELPVKLPKLQGDWSDRRKGNPLEAAEAWVHTKCPKCGGPARRDTDTMDTFVDSSWYFMRFPDAANEQLPFSSSVANQVLPVDIYVGGIEHAILHLLYARFVSKFMATTLWPDGAFHHGEPFKKLISQGMVHGRTFSDSLSGRFVRSDEIDLHADGPRIRATGAAPIVSFEKMSKSKHNGVDPVECIQRYGADVVRAHMLFQAPVTEVLEWDESRIVGMQRWFAKIWRLCQNLSSSSPSSRSLPHHLQLTVPEAMLWTTLQRTIASVTQAYTQTQALNTVISDLIKLTHSVLALPADQPNFGALRLTALSDLLRMLAPIAPAFASECWECLESVDAGHTGSLMSSGFPDVKPYATSTHTCAVQENGKLRFVVNIPKPLEDDMKSEVLKLWVLNELGKTAEGSDWLQRRRLEEWSKVVVVRGGKTVNFVR